MRTAKKKYKICEQTVREIQAQREPLLEAIDTVGNKNKRRKAESDVEF